MADKIGVQQLPGDDEGERFCIVYVDADKAPRQGYVMNTSAPMREGEIREFFAKGGQSESDVDSMFLAARTQFKA